MLLRRLTPAAQLPPALTLEEAKAHLRVTHDAEDGLITGLIAAVADAWEKYVKLPLMRADYLALTTSFSPRLNVGVGEIVNVAKVEYLTTDGDAVEVEASRYRVGLYDPTALSFSFSEGIPLTNRSQEAVRVYFSAGAESAADVPPLRRQALLMLLAHWYENRQPVVTGTIVGEIPLSARYLMDLEREPTL